jgi:hypothetical protein
MCSSCTAITVHAFKFRVSVYPPNNPDTVDPALDGQVSANFKLSRTVNGRIRIRRPQVTFSDRRMLPTERTVSIIQMRRQHSSH